MKTKIGYYIHHEGSGHLQRAQALGPYLQECDVTFFSSHSHIKDLKKFGNIVELPGDEDIPYHPIEKLNPIREHLYSPFYSEGLVKRFSLILSWILQERPNLFHVDVSTEVAEFVTLCGLPLTYVRQSGERNDNAHQRVYRMAQKILAPYPEWMEDQDFLPRYKHIKYLTVTKEIPSCDLSVPQNNVVYLRSSTEKDPDVLEKLRRSLECLAQTYKVTIYGTPLEGVSDKIRNQGWNNDFHSIIKNAGVVMTSVGNNMILEVLQCGRPLILLPERKLYSEQLAKARALKSHLELPYFEMSALGGEELLHQVDKCIKIKSVEFSEIKNEAETFAREIVNSSGF
jgi:UDP-N-acetylglucosamine--N-acetylmuramyl-(pentapeptide) pyrophosphoryl-undecaprenol N-acetylglucosamine transferase